MIRIDRLDHLVLTVASIDATCDFYASVLGMKVEIFSGDRKALSFGNQKINLHQKGHEFEPRAIHPIPGSADLCFIAETAISDVVAHLQVQDIAIEEGPVERTGAMGQMVSVYFRDPDGNLIEVSNYLTPPGQP